MINLDPIPMPADADQVTRSVYTAMNLAKFTGGKPSDTPVITLLIEILAELQTIRKALTDD